VSVKDQLLDIVEHSYEVEQAFAADLTDEQRSRVGTYDKWCAKDALAHIAHWQEQRATRLAAIARGEEPPPSPSHYEQANVACFDRWCNCSWDEVQAYVDEAHAQLVSALRALQQEALATPASDSDERPLWQDIVRTAYTHPLTHIAEWYTERGQPHKAGQLWQEWSQLVAPLDDSAEWQGAVHYNTACSLALSGNAEQALVELRQGLDLRPSLTAWSRQDTDLQSLHEMPEYRKLYAAEYWWKAIDAGPQAEALADQFIRALAMFRQAVKAFPAEEWGKGDTPYQRPAGLALHLVESMHGYCALKRGDADSDDRFDVGWQEKDSSKLPSQDELLTYLVKVEQRLAHFLANADWTAAEELFRWTGSTILSRAAYTLRHTQHHLAEMCLELHRRGHQAPQWQ
jgi:tetratricopeptide (TPR) repeat protein